MSATDSQNFPTANSSLGQPSPNMSDDALAAYRAENVPLYNQQPLKLGLFALNLSNAVICSSVPSTFEMSWSHSLKISQIADQLGFEVIVPAARWRGYDGDIDYQNRTFETLTYAAGLLSKTDSIMVFSTIHASVINPIVAAKAIVTLDHLSNGRSGLNLVMGWNAEEMDMLGVALRSHSDRYGYGAEWIDIVDRIWREKQPFDYSGKFFDLLAVRGEPKPVQPRPVVVNAGGSPAGVAFSARHADFNFTAFESEEAATRYINNIRAEAWAEHRRKIGMIATCTIVCRHSEAEARSAYDAIISGADWDTAAKYVASQGVPIKEFDAERRRKYLEGFIAGSHPLVGTPEQVVDGLASIRRAGVDAVLINFVDYVEELEFFGQFVMPLMRQAGLRI